MASIVSASVSESRQKAEDAHMKTEVQQVRNAVEQYRQDFGSVPTTAGTYSSGNMVAEGTPAYNDVMEQLVPKYMPEVPTSPSGLSYSYLATTDGEDAVFAAALNNDETSTNSNSCGTVDSEGTEWGSCTYDQFNDFNIEYPYEWIEVANYSGDAYSLNDCIFDADWAPSNPDCLYFGDDYGSPGDDWVVVALEVSDQICSTPGCFNLSKSILDTNCTIPDTSVGYAYSNNPELFPNSICVDKLGNITGVSEGSTTYQYFDWYSSNDYAICEIDNGGPVCSGGSSSDFCSCI
jgi:type II secretory pathway pseudopilin PulG